MLTVRIPWAFVTIQRPGKGLWRGVRLARVEISGHVRLFNQFSSAP